MEILSNRSIIKQIRKTQAARRKKQLIQFASAEDFLKEVRSSE